MRVACFEQNIAVSVTKLQVHFLLKISCDLTRTAGAHDDKGIAQI